MTELQLCYYVLFQFFSMHSKTSSLPLMFNLTVWFGFYYNLLDSFQQNVSFHITFLYYHLITDNGCYQDRPWQKGNSLYLLRNLLVLFTSLEHDEDNDVSKNKQRTFSLRTLEMCLNYICFADLTLN